MLSTAVCGKHGAGLMYTFPLILDARSLGRDIPCGHVKGQGTSVISARRSHMSTSVLCPVHYLPGMSVAAKAPPDPRGLQR